MKRALYFAIGILLLLLASITGCKKDSIDGSPKYDIYAALAFPSAYSMPGSSTYIYKNDTPILILGGVIQDMIVKNNAVYSLIFNHYVTTYHGLATYHYDYDYYINSDRHAIQKDTFEYLDIRSITLLRKDFYVVANVYGNKAILYKNGMIDRIFDNTKLYSVKAVDNDLYMCGSIGSTGTYWKNGIPYTVEPSSTIMEIAIEKGNIHLAGYSDQNTQPSPAYWLNNIRTTLPEGRWITGMGIRNGQVLISGNTTQSSQASLLWENNLAKYLSLPKTNGISITENAVCVFGDSQYLFIDSLYTPTRYEHKHVIKEMVVIER